MRDAVAVEATGLVRLDDEADVVAALADSDATVRKEAILAAHGLVKRLDRTTLVWHLAVYERPSA